MVFAKELKKNLMVVPSSGYHFPLPAPDRIDSLFDKDTFEEFDKTLKSSDPLSFKGRGIIQGKIGTEQRENQILRMLW